ncbi:MAG: ricin-type beta-trefoil lectin domain protein, partial [Rhodospirillales bacterium]|nr:ricin-type beta-trefoil lectin domain protein [Rhodospirillales bacterium]
AAEKTAAEKVRQVFLGPATPSAQCLVVKGGSNEIILFHCRGVDRQRWDVPKDTGAFRVIGLCLDTAGPNARNKPLVVNPCLSRKPAQRWALRDGRLVNDDGWCAELAGPPNQPLTPLLAQLCRDVPGQRFTKGDITTVAALKLPPGDFAALNRIDAAIAKESREAVAAQGGPMVTLDGAAVIALGAGRVLRMGVE